VIDIGAIILNGFTTGMGVIFAHEFWEVIKIFRKRQQDWILGLLKKNKSRGEKI
jgi:hypothetical protein